MDASIEKQTEINEWSYNSKKDTLFLFQLAFIGLTLGVVLFWVASTGMIGDTLVMYIMIIIFVILAVVWYMRYTYTKDTRDKVHWNKKVFSEDVKKPSPLPANVVASIASSTNESCNTSGSASGSSRNRDTSWANPGSGSYGDDISWLFDEDEPEFKASWPESGVRGSAAARDASGALYGDTSSFGEGSLGNYDTTGGGFETHPEDVVDRNLNELYLQQGRDYRSIARGTAGRTIADTLTYCKANPGASDPATGFPCKRVWCMANPNEKWKDPGNSVEIPCKTLFPELR